MMNPGEENYFAIFNEASDGIVIMNDLGDLTDANKSMCRMLGYTREELLCMNVSNLINPVQLERDPVAFDLAMSGKHITRERQLQRKDGSIVEMEVNIKRVSENLIIAMGRDVTEKKRAAEELQRMYHDIGERVKELNCLYRISQLIHTAGKRMEDILEKGVEVVSSSYQYPSITAVRIVFNGGTFTSRNFCASAWKQAAPIKINQVDAGLIEVFYTQAMPELDEGPFLKEERALLNSVAEILGSAAERKNAEALVKEQAEMFQAIIENTKEAIYLVSPEFRVLQYNGTAKERTLAACGIELFIGADIRNYLFPDSVGLFYEMFEDSMKGIHRSAELKMKIASGESIWLHTKTSPVYAQSGGLIGVRLLNERIDDRKKAEAELRESEEKFRGIVEQSLVGIYIVQDGKLVYVNPGFEKIFGYSGDQLIHQTSFEGLVYADDIEIVKNHSASRIPDPMTKQQYSFRAMRKDGAILHVEVIAKSILYHDEPAMIGTLVDVTDRVEEERRINQVVLDTQETERYQIGMELHDNVKQILVGSRMFMGIARKKLNGRETAVVEILTNLEKFNAEAIDELRRLSHQLAPLVEADSLLEDKIAWLVRSLKMDEILSVSVHVEAFKDPLDSATQLAFYRILQEQFGNILKYAAASAVEIHIQSVKGKVLLQVKDNGNGFDSNQKREGIGLENIRRRAEMLNGKVEIISSPGMGCEVNVLIPAIPDKNSV